MIQNIYHESKDEDEDDADDDDGDDMEIKFHFVWIKNLSRLLSMQLSGDKNKIFICDRCFHYFYSDEKLTVHTEDCRLMNTTKIRLPAIGQNTTYFRNLSNKISVPFVIYADLECILKECTIKNQIQEHIPCSIGYFVKCCYDDKLSFYKSYRGENCIEWFTNELKEYAITAQSVLLCPIIMNDLTAAEKYKFINAQNCHICEKEFSVSDAKVRDHNHLNGQYRGPSHKKCNLEYQDSRVIPVIFHNLSGYDAHFIIKNLATDFDGRIDLLPINKERYISFTKNIDGSFIKYRFIDSFRFMASSLSELASYMKCYPILSSQFPNLSDQQFSLLTRKGVYPYDYFNNILKFSETSLPSIDNFYNKLTDSHTSPEDYLHAHKVWTEFGIQNMGEYSDLYLKTDVLLLADIFEEFRTNCHQTYGLDPAHYYTLPGYTWDAMMKYTSIRLELLTDIDMIMFVERGIRGGLSQCSKRYSKANNKYIRDGEYDLTKPTKFLIYNDINNQYGWAMSQYLPCGGFQWLTNIEYFDVNSVAADSNIGFILEVDIDYPAEIHDLHNDLPFCPEHCCPPNSKAKKLMSTLLNKKRYIVHYRTLQQALQHGLKLSKIHRILQFYQSPWLQSYIDFNTRLRASATNEFQKNLFKNLNNAVFGKSMENVRKYSIVKLISKWSGRYGAEARISNPHFKSLAIFNENLVAIEMNKSEVYFNKPTYVGMCILDLAKTTLYDFHYDYMLPQFSKSNCSLLYTDTDSLIYEVAHLNIYDAIKRDCSTRFDTSDYPPDNIFGIPLVNKKVLGLMKDENNGKIMTEFIGLRAKMYSFKVDGKNEAKKKCKGIKSYVVKKRIFFDDYVDCLNNQTEKVINQNLIRSRQHNVGTIEQRKIALSPHDDKRALINNSYETMAWGHYKLSNNN